MPENAALERDALVAISLASGEEWSAMREVYEPRHFRRPEHRAAAEAMAHLRNGSGQRADPRAVAALLERAGNVDAARRFLTVIRQARTIGDGCAILRALAADAQKHRAGILDAAAIFAPLPPVRWLCQGLDLAPGAPALFAGYGYSGKTVAAQDFALAVATGGKAWDRFPVRQGKVVHIDYEQGSYLTRLRYQRLARARGIDPRDLSGLLETEPFPPWYLDAPNAYEELVRRCEDAAVVVVDSFRAACPRSDENSSDARLPLDILGRVSEVTGVVPVVLHHARKPQKDSVGGAKMSIRGSGALFDACGCVLVFSGEKGKAATVSHEKARYTGRAAEDFGLWIEDVELDGDPNAGLRVSTVDAGEGKVDGGEASGATFAATRSKVLALAGYGPIHGGAAYVRAKVGGRRDDVYEALRDLVRTGALIRGGSYREPVYSLPGTDHDKS